MKWKKVLAIFFLVVLVVAAVLLYFYYKKPADIRTAVANYETTAPALLAEFNNNEATANAKYLDKVIAVEGTISKVNSDAGNPTVFLETGDPMASVTCSFYDTESGVLKNLKPGSTIKIKGVCTGVLMDVVLNKCSIAE